MIDRYTRPEMGHIFSLENKYAIWQEIEVLACEAQAELGKIGISKDEAQWIRDHANFEKAKVDEIEEVTRHDVIAFLTNMKEYIDADVPEGDPKPSRWVHYGMTSSDLGDTALCYQLTQACDLIIATGGSVVYEPKAMAHLSQLGTVVYLKLGYKALARRLGNLEKRGVVLRPGQTLRMLYDERVPLYEKYANITVDCGGQDIEHTLRRVRRALEKQGNVTK